MLKWRTRPMFQNNMKKLAFYAAFAAMFIANGIFADDVETTIEEAVSVETEEAVPVDVDFVYEVPDPLAAADDLSDTVQFIADLEQVKFDIFGKYASELPLLIPYQYNASTYLNMLDSQIETSQNKAYLLNEYKSFYQSFWNELKQNNIIK